jgi:thiol-disulfide isomerase/thioredoxin
MAWRRLLLASVGFLASGLLALGPGDAAPALDGVTYVKGGAPDFAAQWTLVEFWATWCAPCKRTIPHLTELLKQHGAKLAVVGLSDEDEATVRPFVQAQGEAMGYSVGLVPKDTRERYMQGRSGIPCAFLVSPQKQVAWVGHPAAVDAVLQQAIEGRFDVERAQRVQPLENAFAGALQSRNLDLVTTAAEALLAEEPAHGEALRIRVAIAHQKRDPAGARAAYERAAAATITPATAEALAYALLGDADLAFRFIDVAARFVARVREAAPAVPATLALQARYAYVCGRLDEAIALQEQAVAADPEAAPALAYYRQIKALRDQP